ncbi:MAG: hypothetical protein WBW94_01515, partial [Anaerolineales bacterium]
MSKNKLFSILSASTLIVFVLSAILTVPALADSGTTPPTTPSSGGGRSSNKGSSNSLSQVPSGTKVVVLDSSGNKVALGSQAAADIISSGDPIWCPSTVSAPNNSGLSGCTLPANTLALLISDIGTAGYNPTHTNSTIWISDAAPDGSSGAAIILNGFTQFSAWAPYSLTIKGGWNGTYGSSGITGVSTLSVPLEITHWGNAVTVSNLTVENTNVGDYSTGDGLEVQTSGNISLSNFTAYHDSAYGAYLDNTNGTGTVTITNSELIYNNQLHNYWGLEVLSHGAITLTNDTVDDNYEAGGAYLDNCLWNNTLHVCNNSTAAPVTITSSTISYNNAAAGYQGLQVDSTGVITLNSVTASGNGYSSSGYGAYLDNCNAFLSTCTTNGKAITLTGANIFDGNQGYGLDAQSGGAITSGGLEANDNYSYGAQLDNSGASSAMAVTLTGTSSFSGNTHGDGLDIESTGAITVNNVSADDNGGTGGDL